MSTLWEPRREVRLASITVEDIGHGWHIRLHAEPRSKTGRRREHLVLIDRWNLHFPQRVEHRDTLDELLAEAVLQRRLPGIG